MSESILLSLIFVGLIILFGFIGTRYGVPRGILLALSIFGGAELALWWGGSLGRRLDAWTSMNRETGTFLGSIALLLLTVVVIGFVGSIVLGTETPSRWGSLFGLLLGIGNGAMLIAMALRFYFLSYSASSVNDTLVDSSISRVVWSNFDWFLLGYLATLAVLLLYNRWTRRPIVIPDPVTHRPVPRPIPPPIPKPVPTLDRRNGMVVEAPSARPGADSPRTTSGIGVATVDEDIYGPPRPASAATIAPPEPKTPAPAAAPAASLPSARHTVRFCPNCGMTLDASDRFCPDCGFTL